MRCSVSSTKIALNGGAPPRRSAAATAANLRRRRTGGTGAATGGTTGNMFQFYTDDAPGLKISECFSGDEHWIHCLCCSSSCHGKALLCS
ncbi:hypothetical protein LXL04_001780 [Taraxacum kok-saghyz]